MKKSKQESKIIEKLEKYLKILPTYLICGIIAFFIGILVPKQVKVSYISRSEILEFEKQRIEKEALEDKQLFFGMPDEAVRIIEEYRNKHSGTYKIVLITDGGVYGDQVRSMSKEVYGEIKTELERKRGDKRYESQSQ